MDFRQLFRAGHADLWFDEPSALELSCRSKHQSCVGFKRDNEQLARIQAGYADLDDTTRMAMYWMRKHAILQDNDLGQYYSLSEQNLTRAADVTMPAGHFFSIILTILTG